MWQSFLNNQNYREIPFIRFCFFFKKFLVDTCPFLGPLVPLFWISGDVSSGFQSQSGFCLIRYFCGGECNVHSPRFTSGATLADLLAAGAQPVTSPHACAEVGLGSVSNVRSHEQKTFIRYLEPTNDGIQIFADASGNCSLGFSAYFPWTGEWICSRWPVSFFKQKKPSINLLELYAIVLAVETWAHHLEGQHIRLRSDNLATIYMINRKTSKRNECMSLIRHLTLVCMKFQIFMTAKFREGKRNQIADALSRGKLKLFKALTKGSAMEHPTKIPTTIYPVSWKMLKK